MSSFTKYLDTVFLLHAFEKTTNGVEHKEMATAAKRYKEMKKRVDAEHQRAKAFTARRGK
jgi:phage-related protein